MPQVQVVDTTETPPDPTGIEKFFTRIGKEYKDREDRSQIGAILDQYMNNQQDANAWQNAQLKLEKSNISPTNRLAAQNTLNEIGKNVLERDKMLNAQAKELLQANQKKKEESEKRQREIEESKAILKTGDYTDDEIEELAPKITPTTARSFVSGSKSADSGKEYHKMREKSVADYVQNAFDAGEAAQDQKFVIESARKAIKGDIQGPGVIAMIKENPYGRLFMGLTPDESQLQAVNKKLLEGTKGVFGAKPTEREIFLLLNDMLPSIYKTKEANEAGLDFVDKVNDMKLAHAQIVDQLTEGGTVFVPDLQRKVNEAMRPLHEALLTELKEAQAKFADEKKESGKQENPQGKVRVKIKGSNPPQYGRVTPYPGMEAKYDVISE